METTPETESRYSKVVIYTPFPQFESRKEYDNFFRQQQEEGKFDSKSTKPQALEFRGLPLDYDPSAKKAGWEGYEEHTKELKDFKETHKKLFTNMLSKKEEEYDIIGEEYLTKEGEKLFEDYGPEDIIFIHCHGNMNVIGTGGFVLTPELLAENLKKLGLSQKNPPIIVVWSCNSGKEEFNCKSYAENLREELKKKKMGFKNAWVIGIDAKIYVDRKESVVTYKKLEETKGGKEVEKKKKESTVIKIFTSPDPKKQFEEIKSDYDGLWTQVKKIKESRRQFSIKPVRPLLFSDSEKSEEEKPKKTLSSRRKKPPKRKEVSISSEEQGETLEEVIKTQPKKQRTRIPESRQTPPRNRPLMTTQFNIMRQQPKKQPRKKLTFPPRDKSTRERKPPDRYHP